MVISKEFLEKMVSILSNFHDKIIMESGGEKGIRDNGGFYNSLHKIFTYFEKNDVEPASVAALVYKEFARRHYFNDGNKRTSHAFAKLMLFFMDLHLKVEYKDAVPFIIEIASYDSKITTKQIEEWVKSNLTELPHKNLEKYLNEIVFEINYGK